MFTPINAQTGPINVDIRGPLQNQIVGNTLNINAYVQSTYQLDSLYANVSGRTTNLLYSSGFFFNGSIDLTGLQQDTLLLQVYAKDHFGNVQIVDRKFIYDQMPSIVIEQPSDFSVADPEIRIKAKCEDNLPGCKIKIIWQQYDNAFDDSLDLVMDLSNVLGSFVRIGVQAIDSRGQATIKYMQLFAESSPYLQKYYSAPEYIWDVNYGNILTAETEFDKTFSELTGTYNFLSNLKITKVSNDLTTSIPFTGISSFQYGIGISTNPADRGFAGIDINAFLTPQGAIFTGSDSLRYTIINNSGGQRNYDVNNNKIFDWNNGVLNQVNKYTGYPFFLKAKGNFAIWTESQSIPNYAFQVVSRNLLSKENMPMPLLGAGSKGTGNDITGDGTAVYPKFKYDGYNSSSQLFKYSNGITTYVTDSSNLLLYATNPLTAGLHTAYMNRYSDSKLDIVLHDGVKNTILSTLSKNSVIYLNLYDVNETFVAFTKQGYAQQLQLWLQDTTGFQKQLTFFNDDCILEHLTKEGGIFYYRKDPNSIFTSSSTRRYYSNFAGTTKEISSGKIGRVYEYDNQVYISIGRVLYKVNLNVIPNNISNFSLAVKKDSSTGFLVKDFQQHFSGDGSLRMIKIVSLPLNGALALNGNPVIAAQTISRSDIPKLTYKPSKDYTGSDSLQWSASNGFEFAANNAMLFFSVGEVVLEHPIVEGLLLNYCNSAKKQFAKIINLPRAVNGILITARLDSSILTISDDGIFSFDISNLRAGKHSIEIIFGNSSNRRSTIYEFIISAAIEPKMELSSSLYNATTSSTEPVVITIKNVLGGGDNPTYTFGKNGGFSELWQSESENTTLNIIPSQLAIGQNWIYVRMNSSDSCTTKNSIVDSLSLTKSNSSGLIDSDYPNILISAGPNPFRNEVLVNGLNVLKVYNIFLTNSSGQVVQKNRIEGKTHIQINFQSGSHGVFLLSIYDETKKILIGSMRLVKE